MRPTLTILYLASQTDEAETLRLEREITDVQAELADTVNGTIRAIFLPDLTVESLPLVLSRHRPDILHISVHGSKSGLWFAKQAFDGEGKKFINVSGAALASFLDPEHAPKLILLNACNSHETAQELMQAGHLAIGTTAPITNQAAIAASRLLYSRILGGRTIENAFTAMDRLVRCIEKDGAGLKLYAPENASTESTVLHPVPRMAARLSADEAVKHSYVPVEIGVVGVPAETSQVVFFTDDPTFISEDGDLEEDLAEIVRDNARRGEFWTETTWWPDGDCRIAACGITGGGLTFSVSGMLGDALEYYAKIAPPPKGYATELERALGVLRANDGAGLESWKPRMPKKRSRKTKK